MFFFNLPFFHMAVSEEKNTYDGRMADGRTCYDNISADTVKQR